MKKIVLATIMLFAVLFTVKAQKTYSKEHLQQASVEELEIYYNKALKHQKAGRILNISGISVLGVSGVGIVAFGSSMGMAAILFVFPVAAGIISLAVGVPMNLTAKSRIERIDKLRNTVVRNVAIELALSPQYNYISRRYESALILRIRF